MKIKDVFMNDFFITCTKGGEIFESDGVKMVNVLVTSKPGKSPISLRSTNIILNGKSY